MKKLTIFVDGHYIQVDPKIVEAFTPGIFKARGVFETMLAVGTKVFDTELHLRRLKTAFKGVKISSETIIQVVKANGFQVARVRVVAWQGQNRKHIAVMALKYVWPSKKVFHVCLIKTNRIASAVLSNMKSLDYKLFSEAYKKAYMAGYDEALLLNAKGNIFEASRSNIFWVKDGRLFTPPLSSGCLNGITRRQIIKTARQFKVPFHEKELKVKELESADGAFLCNSLMGIKPIKISSLSLLR